VEEPRAWQGFWNERIAELAELSAQDEQTVSILLTGRGEEAFAELINRMIGAKGLRFDMVCLKPRVSPSGQTFGSTLLFKQALLRDVIFTYAQATEIRLYEDRPKHVKSFRDYFFDLNKALSFQLDAPRNPIEAEVVHVSEEETTMDPISEVAEVQHMINVHNQAILDGTAPPRAIPYKIKRSVFYTGYIIGEDDIEKLRTLIKLPANCPEHEARLLANNILITPRPAPPSILQKVGGIGSKVTWRVTGLGQYENRVWAARVEPVPATTKIYSENKPPQIVLATRRNAKPVEATHIRNWQPVPASQAYQFETTVGEKVLLRIEEEFADEDAYEASFPHAKNARKHPREEDFPPLGSTGNKARQQQSGNHHQYHNNKGYGNHNAWTGRGGGYGGPPQRGNAGGRAGRGGAGGQRGFHRGRGGNAAGRGRGRGGYKSLDDNPGAGYDTGGMQY
jgi:hypothetical protein